MVANAPSLGGCNIVLSNNVRSLDPVARGALYPDLGRSRRGSVEVNEGEQRPLLERLHQQLPAAVIQAVSRMPLNEAPSSEMPTSPWPSPHDSTPTTVGQRPVPPSAGI